MSKSFVSSLTLSITSSKGNRFFAHISVNETSDYNRSSVFLHNPGIKINVSSIRAAVLWLPIHD